jgi:hypothetical protein
LGENLNREEIERILKNAGWRPTMSAPPEAVDYQTSTPKYNRIILFPYQFPRVTEEALRELMRTESTSEECIKVLRKHDL